MYSANIYCSLLIDILVTLDVDDLRDVIWDEHAFDRLVLDNIGKYLIRDLVAERANCLTSSSAAVLLHGAIGTGKTLAAEVVAELTQNPLLRITCAEVGANIEQARQLIESKMKLATRWRCVVVFENIGILLTASDGADLKRQAFVSMFENILEVHQGLVILTTRQPPRHLDVAIMSRIHLGIHCPVFEPSTRTQIWRGLLRRLRSLEHSDDAGKVLGSSKQLERLAEYRMNGWEISNAATSSANLARRTSKTLDYGCVLEWLSQTAGHPRASDPWELDQRPKSPLGAPRQAWDFRQQYNPPPLAATHHHITPSMSTPLTLSERPYGAQLPYLQHTDAPS